LKRRDNTQQGDVVVAVVPRKKRMVALGLLLSTSRETSALCFDTQRLPKTI